ncbi:MAG: hypothetical protein ASARMPRED_000579 [Alectoria sarmentosa]|nr:MAG: hypothetical protein ASARMPRED_000579 [Alectoria sarmentosa]
MHLSLSFLSLLPLTMALQTIYLAVDTSSGQQYVSSSVLFPLSINLDRPPLKTGTYIAFFSDSDPCNDGTRFGNLPQGFDNCNQNLTILGHPDITFTGCKPYTGYPGSLPTGVSDGGAPALKCVSATNPPSATSRPNAEYGVYEICNTNNGGFVNVVEYCS